MELWVPMQGRTSNYKHALHKDCRPGEANVNESVASLSNKMGVVQVKLNLANFRCNDLLYQGQDRKVKIGAACGHLILKQPSDCRAMACSDICWSARTDIAHGMQQPRSKSTDTTHDASM